MAHAVEESFLKLHTQPGEFHWRPQPPRTSISHVPQISITLKYSILHLDNPNHVVGNSLSALYTQEHTVFPPNPPASLRSKYNFRHTRASFHCTFYKLKVCGNSASLSLPIFQQHVLHFWSLYHLLIKEYTWFF